MRNDVELDYGLNEAGRLVHISKVPNGKNCKCVCPSCGIGLIAVNNEGNTIRDHFKHRSVDECKHYYETLLHLMSKEILLDKKKLCVPKLHYPLSGFAFSYWRLESKLLKPSIDKQLITLDNVIAEKKEGAIVPDLIAEVKGKIIYLEIAVTHFIDEDKLKKLVRRRVPTLEIDLSDLDRNIQYVELSKILVGDIKRKKWIFNPKPEQLKQKFLRTASLFKDFIFKNSKEIKVYGREEKIYGCPMYKEAYDFIYLSDCTSCRYHVDHYTTVAPSEPTVHDQDYVNCIGHWT